MACLFAAALLAAIHPAVAASDFAAIAGAVSCATTAGCVSGNNTSSGPGVTGTSSGGSGITASGVTGITATGTAGPGISATAGNGYGIAAFSNGSVGIKGLSNLGYGVEAASTKNHGAYGITDSSSKAGVYGTAAGGSGVYGSATGFGDGVYGTSATGYGVYGTNASGNNRGVFGYESGSGVGTYGSTSSGVGVQGLAGAGFAVAGIASGGTGLYGYNSNPDSGRGANVWSNEGTALEAFSDNSQTVNPAPAITAINSGGNDGYGDGIDITGSHVAIWGRSGELPLYLGYPSIFGQPAGNVFAVDTYGDIFYTGSLNNFVNSRITGSASVRTFIAKSAQPTVEDTGTAQLVAGAAAVALDPTFAGTIDPRSPYRVFLTPDGDTRGLYVASKTAAGFIVRESQAGHATVSFDYRIVATALGQTGQRIAVTTAAFGPHTTLAIPPKHAVPHPLAPRK